MTLDIPLEIDPHFDPTRSITLLKRSPADSAPAPTDSNGCVICEDAPTCPTCASNEQCAQTVQTCTQCPRTYCKASVTSSSSSSSTNVGGIAGGVIGGVVGLAVIFFLLYKYYFKRVFAFNRVQQKEYYFDDDIEINFHHNLPQSALDPNLNKPSSRTSIATTILSRASNIIPIAYIPGVTIGSNSKSSRLSTISQATTMDSDITGDRFSKASIVGNPSMTTTAIRARPKLVTVTNPDSSRNPDDPNFNKDSVPGTAINVNQLGGVKAVRVNNNRALQKHDQIIEEEEEEDEEEVEDTSAESAVPNKDNATIESNSIQNDDDYEPFIIDDEDNDNSDNDRSGRDDSDDEQKSTNDHSTDNDDDSRPGSVLLEVDLDTNTFNPFDDPHSDH